MSIMTASQARKNFYRLVDQVGEDHVPVFVTGKRHSAVLISEEDWRSIEETLYLTSIPGMADSIRDGMRIPPSKMSKALKW